MNLQIEFWRCQNGLAGSEKTLTRNILVEAWYRDIAGRTVVGKKTADKKTAGKATAIRTTANRTIAGQTAGESVLARQNGKANKPEGECKDCKHLLKFFRAASLGRTLGLLLNPLRFGYKQAKRILERRSLRS